MDIQIGFAIYNTFDASLITDSNNENLIGHFGLSQANWSLSHASSLNLFQGSMKTPNLCLY